MVETISLLILPVLILLIFVCGFFKKVPVYEEFVEGAKDGFKVAISIIPYLVALIVGVSMFRACGIFDLIANMSSGFMSKFSLSPDIIPLIFTRPLSGSAALGIFSELASEHGADAYITKLAAIMLGSSETTFYVLSVYFGSIGIKKFRYALLTGIIADVISIALAIWVAQLFFLAKIA